MLDLQQVNVTVTNAKATHNVDDFVIYCTLVYRLFTSA